jgi:hypothetical protein
VRGWRVRGWRVDFFEKMARNTPLRYSIFIF